MRQFYVLLSDCPHQYGFDRRDISAHIVAMETESSLESETVSGSKSCRDQLRIREKGIAEIFCVFRRDRDLESVFA